MKMHWLMSAFAVSSIFFGSTVLGCGGEDIGEDGESLEGEFVAQTSQAFSACTPLGSGGGTWGDVITLCTSDGYLSVKKQGGGSFTSSGTMKLYKSSGSLVLSKLVSAGAGSVSFGLRPAGCYYAIFYADVGGTAYTGTLCQ